MDREDLAKHLADGLSLREIGELYGRDHSTVGYWVRQHGLEANGRRRNAPRGGLEREQLEPLIERGLTLAQIADELDRSISTVIYWLKRHGLAVARRRRGHASLSRAAEAAGEKRFDGHCNRHGDTAFLVLGRGRSRCARCNVEAVARHRRSRKERLVERGGGCCCICGYNRNLAALEFHHLDPSQKEFGIGAGHTRSFERVAAEARKCLLVCGNCHAEIEAGALEPPLE